MKWGFVRCSNCVEQVRDRARLSNGFRQGKRYLRHVCSKSYCHDELEKQTEYQQVTQGDEPVENAAVDCNRRTSMSAVMQRLAVCHAARKLVKTPAFHADFKVSHNFKASKMFYGATSRHCSTPRVRPQAHRIGERRRQCQCQWPPSHNVTHTTARRSSIGLIVRCSILHFSIKSRSDDMGAKVSLVRAHHSRHSAQH
jgi:hypothetical protein